MIFCCLLIFFVNISMVTAQRDYAQSMVNLLSDLNSYTKAKKSKFYLISNGGYNLYNPKARTKEKMLQSVDGVLIEDAFTHSDKKKMQQALQQAIKSKRYAFSIEYKSFKTKKQIISYSAKKNKNLRKIPKFISSRKYDVNNLSDVKNFIAVLDPGKYKSKKKYLKALKNTDYDLIFIDLYYDTDDKPLSAAEVKSLKKKKNGGKRLVCSYLSVGEAENYRYYWKSKWNKKSKRPEWIKKENKEWKGNYKVQYWDSEWKSILYNYSDKILKSGFDGVYLDVIDAYEYFEK